MEIVLRAAAVYAFVWLVFRLSGRRTFAEMTTFDFVLVLILSEGVQQALLGQDFSITAAMLVVLTLVGIDVFLSKLKESWPASEKILDGLPIILIDNGELVKEHMERARVDEADILDEARKSRALSRMDQIQYAVLERNGEISVIPFSPAMQGA